MDYRLDASQEAFVAEIRRFLDEHLTEDVQREVASAERMGPHAKAFLRKMADRKWLSIQWPEEWGGLGRPPLDRFLLTEELAYRGAPGAFTSNTGGRIVAPVIIMFGTQEQKERFLPPIQRGDIDFALGYTEPNAGSDLASLQMRAELDGDHYIVTGQKMFNTACHFAEYHWLAVRTDPTAPKHKGISLMIVDLKSPGIEIKPIWTMAEERTNAVYYDRVRVPRQNLIGQPNAGFYYLAKALEFERMFVTGDIRRFLERFIDGLRNWPIPSESPTKDWQVRQKVAQLAIDVEVCKQLSMVVAWQMEQGNSSGREASVVKLFKTELDQRLARVTMETLGLYGQLQRGSVRVPMNGRFEHFYRRAVSTTITGGTSEVQRNVIAQRGLGLPR
ncbi:MAG: acyl-CoA dehydrogenase family protein [Chloroflexi bacterium]|nr:acyl-CoA dehydrogenase family protein [Chloroflexota bacterium]